MYEIRPETISTFIEDGSIKLPRFQRKQTWDEKKNFELCISIFKDFPMGVCILNVEKDVDGRITKWLLDGRQRRNAFLSMWENPENIYDWARKWVGFKANDQPADVAEKFRNKILEYLEDDENDSEAEKEAVDIDIEQQDDSDSISLVSDEDSLNQPTIDLSKRGVDFLLEIVLLIHNKTAKFSGFTRPFNFTKHIDDLPYQEYVNAKPTLSCRKLKSFIDEFRRWCSDNGEEVDSIVSFKSFFSKRFNLSPDKLAKVEIQITENWSEISARIEILRKLQELLRDSRIGLIEVKDIRSTDSQKIFNIINSKGTKLNAVEILSAKPSWNRVVNNPGEPQIKVKDELYARIGIRYEGVVRWDLPATLLPRLNDIEFYLDITGDKNSALEKQLIFGFKLLSGIIESGIRKENVDNLSRNGNINWDTDFETVIEDLNRFTKVMLDSTYFKFLRSWRQAVMNLTSDAVALNFILVSFADWKRKGRPLGTSVELKQFQKNSFILLDQLFYEYVTRQWRGSSDSKIATNLQQVATLPPLFSEVSPKKWSDLLKEIFDENLVSGVKISQKVMEPILYHFYAIRGIAGANQGLIEVDHIIPQSSFKSSSFSADETLPHNLFNLALLPKKENISKSNKTLSQISDIWLKQQVCKYADLEESDFERFSNISYLNELKQKRRGFFENAFGQLRTDILNN